MTMEDLLQRVTTIWMYIKLKDNATTSIQTKPQQNLVEKHVEGLGFKMIDRTKKTCKIMVGQKVDDYRLILSLAHYSLRLSSVVVMESCYGFTLLNHTGKTPLKVNDLYEKGTKLAEIFRSEHIFNYKMEIDRFS
jgi:hypothetical protein